MSGPFEFRLARVLRVRTLEEELARNAWQAAVHAARNADERAADLRHRRDTALAELSTAMSAGLTPADWIVQAGLIDRISDALVVGEERARTLEKQAEALVEPLRARHAEVRQLERLRDKQAAAHRRESTRKEAVLMDEVALTRAAWAPLASIGHDVADPTEPPTDSDSR